MKENRDFGVRMAEQVEFNVKSEPYKNFITSIDSPVTRCDYRYYLAYFMKFIKCTNYLDLIQEQPKQIESLN